VAGLCHAGRPLSPPEDPAAYAPERVHASFGRSVVVSPAMKSEIWLPLVTLALGWAGGIGTEAFRDRRASERERQARQAELQRSTLLELQDALLETANLAREANAASYVATLDDLAEGAKRLAEERAREARSQLEKAQSKAGLLASRIQDDQARQAVTTLIAVASMVALFNPKTDEADLKRLRESFRKAIDLLGKLIRERY
jgi:hypothetical protein